MKPMPIHPTMLEWLVSFEQDCAKRGPKFQPYPTLIYNSLVMLGIERPDHPRGYPPHGFPTGCDCLETISDGKKDIKHALSSIEFWKKLHTEDLKQQVDNVKRNEERIARNRESIALAEVMHASHAGFNRRVHFILRNACSDGNGAKFIAKVRAVCLRDLRTTCANQLAPNDNASRGIVTNPSYGKELATFLVPEPQGWW